MHKNARMIPPIRLPATASAKFGVDGPLIVEGEGDNRPVGEYDAEDGGEDSTMSIWALDFGQIRVRLSPTT